MLKDPIVNEVRQIRYELECKYEDDAEEFYKWLVTLQKKYSKRIVRRHPAQLVKSFNVAKK